MLIPANPRGGFWLHVTHPHPLQIRLGFSNELRDMFRADRTKAVVVTRSDSKLWVELVERNEDVRSRALNEEGSHGSIAALVPRKLYGDVPLGSYRPIVLTSKSFEIDFSAMLQHQKCSP